ncbi:helix-hairpin-helix domain-containing protein [Clostridium thermarum]|uniref:helix-hairpin-helix domain-containing protein n=1 Tax=Clostridium thermarum TaxID=1716543 RepID=UPI001124B4EE|nr:helix-hairpin-helix domain-containing protein [Clostridium thermarum]
MNKKNKIIGSVIIIIIFSIFTIVGVIKDGKEEDYGDIFVESKPATSNLNSTVSETAVKYIKVEIKGEIKRPGVYSMSLGSRLEDLIYKAGGFTEKANKDRIPSLAKKLKDEECIVIPNIDAPKESLIVNNIADSDEDIININTADKDDLQKIPGVGPVTAQKILDYREKHGYFNSVEEMKNIDGIGDKTLDKMREKITVD